MTSLRAQHKAKFIWFLGTLLAMLATAALAGQGNKGVPGSNSGNYGAQYEKTILQGVKISDEFQINETDTTNFGPAWADIWLRPENFLACYPPEGQELSYALCYYSGPQDGTGDADNPPLPCTLSPNGKVANCTCYKLSSDVVPPKVPYYVDINSILNQEVYDETVAACGSDGSLCGPNTGIAAPVCDAINANKMVPGADLISVFSPVMKLHYPGGSTECGEAVYAGCMTAPCYDTGETDENGLPLVDCSCPVFDGRFEIGQGADPAGQSPSCNLGGTNVWSAAHNPITNNAYNPGPVTGCTPDAPPDTGCPLFPDGIGTNPNPQPGGKVCQAICNDYKASESDGIQRGYACDSTLCTTLGLGQELPLMATSAERLDLMAQACSGIRHVKGLKLIAAIEELAGCSCCASQICGCDETDINPDTNSEIFRLNAEQHHLGIKPQCYLNGTLCGRP